MSIKLDTEFFGIEVSIVISVIKRLNTSHYEKWFNQFHVWCSNVACYADIESLTPSKKEKEQVLGMTNRSTNTIMLCWFPV